jgi:hypothetical protein
MPSHKNKAKQQQSADTVAGSEDVITFTTPDKDVQWAQTFFTAEGATDEDACLPPADVGVTVEPFTEPAAPAPVPAAPAAVPPAVAVAAAAVAAPQQEEIRLLRQQLEQQSALIQMLLNQQRALPPAVPVAPIAVVAAGAPAAPRAPESAPATPTSSRGRASAFRSKVPTLPNQTPVVVDHLARLRNSTAKTSTGSLRQKDVQGKRTPSVINFRDEIRLGSTYTTKGFGGLV